MEQQGFVVAVAGARGGCGATTLACALALTAARRGCSTVLVDGDPFGGGLDLVLGLEDAPGARWPDVVRRGLRVAELPRVRTSRGEADLHVLSHGRTPGPSSLDPVLPIARTAADLVVLDAPRPLDERDADPAAEADAVVLVVPAEVRACAAATARLTGLRSVRDIRLVVRGPAPGGLAADTVATALGLPLDAELDTEPRLAATVERGRLPSLPPRSALARASGRLLEALDAAAPAA